VGIIVKSRRGEP